MIISRYSNSKIKSILLCFILSLKSIVFTAGDDTQGKLEALIFHRHREALIDLPDEIPNTMVCGPWATACPVPESSRGDLMKNALVIKQIYRKGTKASEMDRKVCDQAYKPSIVYDMKINNFKFGYAIYHELNDDQFFRRFNLRNFITPKEATEFMKNYSIGLTKGKIVQGDGFRRIKAAEKEPHRASNEEIWFNEDERMEFTWINLFSLRFDFFKKILIKIQYFILQNNKWPVGEQCEKYTLGSDVYDETVVDNLYSEVNQKKILKDVKTPVKSTLSPYFKKWLLIPIDQFLFGSSAGTPVCSDIATIPIWADTTEKVLIRVDQFLFALFQVLNKPLVIVSGISEDILELPLKSGKPFKKKVSIYLDAEKKKIPVPRIVYKMVKYRADESCTSDSNCWSSAIIIVHNDPYYDKTKNTNICKDVTTDWGWADITKHSQDGSKFNNIYVCRNEPKILMKLLGRSQAAKQKPTNVLNLKLLEVRRSANGGTIGIQKAADAVHEELQNWDANGTINSGPVNDIIVREQQNDRGDEADDDGDDKNDTNAVEPNTGSNQ